MSTTAVTAPRRGSAAPSADPADDPADDPPARLLMSPLGSVEVPPSTRVATALVLLRERGTDHLVIRGPGPVRAVTELALLRHLLEAGSRPTRMLDPVSAIATPVPSVGPELRRSRAADLMLTHEHPLLLVVADGEPCGVLDARTVLRSLGGGRDHRPTA